MDNKLLTKYLNDHLAGATAGRDLSRRTADGHADRGFGKDLARLAEEIDDDRDALIAIMASLGIRPNRIWAATAGFAEKLGRLKPNGYIIRRSPLSDLIELEALRVGVAGKLAGWEALLAAEPLIPDLDRGRLDEFIERAHDQAARIRAMHLRLAEDRLTKPDAGY
jgi:hypothetical protein